MFTELCLYQFARDIYGIQMLQGDDFVRTNLVPSELESDCEICSRGEVISTYQAS